MKSKKFAKDICEAFQSLNYKSYICKKSKNNEGYDVILRNKYAHKFFKEIKSNNPRKVRYYETFCKSGGLARI